MLKFALKKRAKFIHVFIKVDRKLLAFKPGDEWQRARSIEFVKSAD